MEWYEILVIVVAVLFVLAIFGVRIIKLINHKPIDECACCGNKGKKLVKYYKKQKQKEQKKCCCK